MIFNLSPRRKNGRPEMSVSGDTLTIDGEEFDFSVIPNGATLPRSAIASDWIVGDVTRASDGTLGPVRITLSLGPNAPEEARFPDQLTVTDGPVVLPPYDQEPAEESEDE